MSNILEKNQIFFDADDTYAEVVGFIVNKGFDNIFVVCGPSINKLLVKNVIEDLSKYIKVTYFSGFTPNPTYSEVLEGVKEFKKTGAKCIFAVGGGSAMDVAKCIKAYSTMDDNVDYFSQKIEDNDVYLIALPTTAGTGSESTRYSVICKDGVKQSVADVSLIFDAVIFDNNTLIQLPLYHKKATLLDALSHSIESFWSVNSEDESKKYAVESIELILDNYREFLSEKFDDENYINVCRKIMKASNLAGKAINLTQTTAGHALSYTLTGEFGLAHGHAVALCLKYLWPFMEKNISKCNDKRGASYLDNIFKDLQNLYNKKDMADFISMYDEIGLCEIYVDKDKYLNIIDMLVDNVNLQKLANNPVKLNKDDIREIYENMIKIK